jgi:iron-only hydrogenase group A
VRVALGEPFGIRGDVSGKRVSALRALGFARVFDLDFAADLTIMEEGTEFLKRIEDPKAKMPMFTSCCPAWINFVRMFHPELLPNVSTTKSPQQIFGAIIKSYYAKKANIAPEKIFHAVLMPCTAKQSELEREGIDSTKKFRDIDVSLTVRQLVRLIREYNVNFAGLKDAEFDNPLSLSSGAGLIFGTTGGVMEAALRTLSEKLLGKRLDNIDFHDVRGEKGIKEATVTLGKKGAEKKVSVAVVSGIANAERVICDIKNGTKNYSFIEIMACHGGCVNGGGMPVHDGVIQDNAGNARERANVLYHMDKYNNLRRSHENPQIIELYKDFLGEPNGHLSHELLHTSYKPKEKYNK